MEISFQTKHLRLLSENQAKASEELGDLAGGLLMRRLSDLRAVTNISELIVGNARHFRSDYDNTMILNLNQGLGILFSANHVKNPVDEHENIVWALVKRIKILDIVEVKDD